MRWKPTVFAAAVALAASASGFGPQAIGVAHAACMAGDKVDGSTAEQAKKKIEASGYRSARDLKKGCDNYWHGMAMKDGASVNVGLAPDGKVYTEGGDGSAH